jgi:uncharacterized protein YjbI with pentapeptide repeats
MRTRNVRDTRVALPVDDPEDLEPFTRVPRSGERLIDHTITGTSWARATISDAVISQCWLTDADLASATFADVTLDRCVFKGCTLMGSNWNTATLRDVIFEDCRLDYSTFHSVTTAGPVTFVRCSFTEVSISESRLTRVAFDQCRLAQLEFGNCELQGADMRGNDLSDLAAVSGLRGVQLDQTQLLALAGALVRELSINVTAD